MKGDLQKMKTEEQTLSMRISRELADKINAIASAIGVDASEIVRKVARFTTRNAEGARLLLERAYAERQGKERLDVFLKVRNFPAVEMSEGDFRKVLSARCDEAYAKCMKYKAFSTDLAEGRDYVVVQEV